MHVILMANQNKLIELKKLEIEQIKDERSGYAQFLPLIALLVSVFSLFIALEPQGSMQLAQLASFLSIIFSITVYLRYKKMTDEINGKYGELQKLMGSA